LPIIVGGTNYYIESLLWNFLLDSSPEPVGCSISEPVSCPQTEPSADTIKDQFSDTDSDDLDSPTVTPIVTRPRRSTVVHTEAAYSGRTTEDIVTELKTVDLESARRIHPKDRRKIIRYRLFIVCLSVSTLLIC